MTWQFILAAVATPIVGGLHRYSASYGYRGVSRAVAWGEGWRVAAMISICESPFVVLAATGH